MKIFAINLDAVYTPLYGLYVGADVAECVVA